MYFVIPFCFFFIVSAFGNQLTVPVQLYPAYQQSVYNSPTPVVYQTGAASYNNPCAQYTISQNPVPNQILNNLVSKVLSNPTIHRILDPNTRFYNQNGVEFQNQIYNRETVPNIINNYFIVPPEFLKLNQTELSTLTSLPNLVNKAVEQNAVDDVEILTNIPQANFGTKENLVRVIQDTPQITKTIQPTTQRRKTRRKKGKKRVRNKILSPQNTAKAIGSYITTSNSQNIQDNLEKLNITEEIANKTQDNVKLEFKETATETTNQNSVNSENDEGLKKKSKKRRKSKINASSVLNTMEITHDNTKDNVEITDNNPPRKLGKDTINAKETTIQDFNMNNDQTCPGSSTKELNEECFEDLGSLITCLSQESRLTRNSRDEVIWRDFRQNFPDVPENLARSMLTFAQNQYQYPQYNNNFYPPLPFGFDHIYQMPHMYNYGKGYPMENRPKTRSRRRKNKKRRAKNKKRNNKPITSLDEIDIMDRIAEDFDESATTTMEDLVSNIITTTENFSPHTEEDTSSIFTTNLPIGTEVVSTTLPSTEEAQNDYDHKHLELEEAHERYEDLEVEYHGTPELGEEYTVPLIYTNGLIDDYYPIFTDNAYYANDHEYTVADVNERHYYTTDRNLESFSRDRRKMESLKEAVPKILQKSFSDVVPKHTYFDADRESYKNLIKDKFLPKSQFKPIVPPVLPKETFKTPPALENPDFRTKRINKDPLTTEDHETLDSFDEVATYFDYAEKSSIYSNAKTPLYNSNVKSNSEIGFVLERPAKSAEGEVETSFARSKVAKFGVEGDDMSSEFPTIDGFKDEEVSVVTAQSLVYPEDYW